MNIVRVVQRWTLAGLIPCSVLLCCQAAARDYPLRMLEEGERRAPREIADYPAAIDAIMRVLVRKLELPVPRHTLEIHATRESFEAALVEELKLDPAVARSTARFAKSAVGGRKVLVNEPAVAGTSWAERIELLAHELVHTVQLELAGHRPLTRNQWMLEGFAEWIAFRVTDALGLDDLARARARMLAQLREVRRARPLPALQELDTLEGWVAARNAHGFTATYSLSFVIMDFLVERHSMQAVVDYFRRFRVSQDHAANFSDAFGESIGDFETALQRRLAQLLE